MFGHSSSFIRFFYRYFKLAVVVYHLQMRHQHRQNVIRVSGNGRFPKLTLIGARTKVEEEQTDEDDQTIEDGEYDNGESFKRRACAPRVAQSPDNHRPAKISSTMMLFSRSLSILNWI